MISLSLKSSSATETSENLEIVEFGAIRKPVLDDTGTVQGMVIHKESKGRFSISLSTAAPLGLLEELQ